MGVRIVTDSTSDIPADLIKKYKIIELPLTVHFADNEYRDKVDLTPGEFYSKLAEAQSLPTTSQINPAVFADTYKEILSKGDSVISIHISGDLSGTYQSALLAKALTNSNEVTVIDSRTATLALGMIVLKAAQLASMGLKHHEIVSKIEEYKNKIKLLIVVNTLEYLRKGGRLSGAKAFIGGVFNIKPVLTVKDGRVVMIDKVKGIKRAVNRVVELMKKEGSSLDNQVIGVANAKAPEMADEIKKAIIHELGVKEFIEAEVGCVIATHVGPGAFGVVFE